MTEIPEAAIDAALEAWIIYTDGNDRGSFTGQGLVTAVLQAAEKAWPHKQPERDVRSTTSAGTERAWQPQLGEGTTGTARGRPFGFGVTKA